jgi:phosphopantetheinyl transferase
MNTLAIPLEEKIARTQRLLRRLEEDQPYLRARLSALSADHRQSANAFADRVRAEAEAELQRLLAERALSSEGNAAQFAD